MYVCMYLFMADSLSLIFLNDISTFVDYLVPKPSLEKNSADTILLIAVEIRKFMPFLGVLHRQWM